MLRLVEEGGGIYSPSPVNSGKVRRARKNIVPIVSVVFKTSASEERKEWGKWSLKSLVISH